MLSLKQYGDGMMSHVKPLYPMVAGILVLSALVVSAAAKDRPHVSGNPVLMLDGKNVGFIHSAEGGAIMAEVIREPAGPAYFLKKHIGMPRYEDLVMHVGFGMSKGVYEWIQQAWKGQNPRKTGSLVVADAQMQAQSEQKFFDATIASTTIPAVDATSKEPAYITLALAPAYTRIQKPVGKIAPAESGTGGQKVFLPFNFKLEIDGLDCSKVTRVESFTVKQTWQAGAAGSDRIQTVQPGKLEFPNLRITLAEANAQSFLDWHERFVIKGENGDSAEKNGRLTLLTSNPQAELLRIRFFNMGICGLQPEEIGRGADPVRQLMVEMYVERMEFECVGAGGDSDSTGTTTPAAPATPAAPRNLAPTRRG